MEVCGGKYHKYVAMSLDYSNKGECCVKICNYLDEILDVFDEAVEKHWVGWIVFRKQCLRKMSAHDNLPSGNDDRKRLSTKALASLHLIVAKVLYASKRSILDMSLGVEFMNTGHESRS